MGYFIHNIIRKMGCIPSSRIRKQKYEGFSPILISAAPRFYFPVLSPAIHEVDWRTRLGHITEVRPFLESSVSLDNIKVISNINTK